MNHTKATAIILVIIGLIGSNFIIKNFLIDKNSVLDPIVKPENHSAKKSKEITGKYPLRWVKNNQESLEQSEQEEKIQQQPQIFSEIKLKAQNLTDFIQAPEQTNKSGDYYKSFLEALMKASFTNEELALIKKERGGERVLLLEELMEQAASGADLDEFRFSFLAWHNLDEKILAEINKIPVKPEIVHLHQPMVEWFQYHSGLAKKMSEENFSQSQTNQLFQEFQTKAKIHTTRFEKSLSKLKNSPDFVLIPMAQAFTCGAFMPPPFYHFGGRVITTLPCNFGIVEIISPPCGGALLFTYPVLAANPFLWKKPTIGSAILGRSVVAPGVCPLGACPACTLFPYKAIVLYFGTSLLP